MKGFAWLGAMLAVGFVAGYCAGQPNGIDIAEAREAREAAEDRAEEAEQALNDLRAFTDPEIERLTGEVDGLTVQLEEAYARPPRIIERVVREAGPDSAVVRAAVTEVADSIMLHIVAPLEQRSQRQDSIINLRTAEIMALETLAEERLNVINDLHVEVAALESNQPSWLERHTFEIGAVSFVLGVASGNRIP